MCQINFSMRTIKSVLLIFIITLSFSACKSKQTPMAVKGPPTLANAPVIIYKTKADYSLHVPVTLSEDKQSITSFPAPSDVYYGGDFAYPIALADGFYLDRRGVDENSAFTKWTYYEYSRLSKSPSETEITNMILDRDPFIEIYHCGNRNDFRDIEKELNTLIAKGELSKFKKLK